MKSCRTCQVAPAEELQRFCEHERIYHPLLVSAHLDVACHRPQSVLQADVAETPKGRGMLAFA
jgi:hypothetical protein